MATDLERFVSAPGRDDLVKEVRRADRRVGRHVHLLPVHLGHRAGSWARACPPPTGSRWRARASSSSTARPPTSSSTATASTSATAPRRPSSSACPSPRRSRCCRGTPRSRACGAPASAAARISRTAARYLTADCRNNLKLIQADFTRSTGMHLRAGLEPEMIWLKADEDGKPTFEGMSKPYCYHIDQFSQFQPIIHKVIEYANAMGLDMIQGDHEDAPGQLELNFNFDIAEKHRRQPLHLPPGLQAGRARDAGLPVLHAQAVHGRLGQRLPPQHLAVGRRRQQVHARARRGSAHARPDRQVGDRRHPRAPRRADGDQRLDGQLVPPALGHGLLGAGLRRLGLPEPHDRAARLGARAASSTARSTPPSTRTSRWPR